MTVPWSFVIGTGRVRSRRWLRVRWLPAVRLVDGRLIALRFAGHVPVDGQAQRGRRGGLRALSLIDSAISEHKPHDDSPSSTQSASPPAVGVQRKARRSRAPFPFDAAQEIPKQRLPAEIRGSVLTAAFLATGQLARAQSGSGHPFNAAQFALGTAAVVATAAVVTLVLWASWTRRLVITPEAIAWKSRLSRRWRTFYRAELVTTKRRVASKPLRRLTRNKSSNPSPVSMSIRHYWMCVAHKAIRARDSQTFSNSSSSQVMTVPASCHTPVVYALEKPPTGLPSTVNAALGDRLRCAGATGVQFHDDRDRAHGFDNHDSAHINGAGTNDHIAHPVNAHGADVLDSAASCAMVGTTGRSACRPR